MKRFARYAVFPLLIAALAAQTKPAPSPSKALRGYFEYVNGKVLDMAKDFPEDKYDYRPTKEMRSFGELIVHIASGNVYAAKVGKGEQANWDELDAKNYKTKADIVGLLQKSIDDSTAALKAEPDEEFTKTLRPWLAVMQHSSEHYGLLVAYYRLNGMVPPETRKEQKK
ncbi:MAG TPA: DinB family protein [Bryobacteraceae bacterium]|nr:DinB family protein [Bryobacteraceae bacterium]